MFPESGDPAILMGAVLGGLLASVACGLGALPLAIPRLNLQRHIGMGYALAGGLMIAASVYNLILPAFVLGTEEASRFPVVLQTIAGMAAGCLSIWAVQRHLAEHGTTNNALQFLGGRTSILVFLAMTFHSIPEGIAVGVGFASEAHLESAEGLGWFITVAIAIHNIPEGLAVALPMRADGASIWRCAWAAFLTSLPQPIAAIPACLLVWLFKPLMLPFLGFAAGAMMYLVVVELIPDGLETHSRSEVAFSFMIGFGIMTIAQLGL